MDKLRGKVMLVVIIALILTVGSFFGIWQNMNAREATATEQQPEINLARAGSADIANSKIVVYVSGAVNQPGVLRIAAGTRVMDAINAAGGLTAQADVTKVNLAKKLKDGMHVNVCEKKISSSRRQVTPTGTSAAQVTGSKVNINRAEQKELEGLPGVGPKVAQRIMEYRQEHGFFQKPEDIIKVPGIGPAKFNRLKDSISL